jgi:alanine racemase
MALAIPISEPAHSPAAPETGGTLTIDLAAIEANWRTLVRELLTVECAAVVKANAYGLGLEPVTATLAKAGCKTFFVADIAEARAVRSRAGDAIIYVLDGFAPDWSDAFIEINARPVINSTTELAEWDAFVSAHSWRGGAALHIDTGMRRLGIAPDEAAALAPRAQTENHGIALIMSHLACADTPDHPLNETQIKLFRDPRSPSRPASFSATRRVSIWRGREQRFMASIPRPASPIRCRTSSN